MKQPAKPKLANSGKKNKRDIDFALTKGKSSKKKQLWFNFAEREMEGRFKRPKAQMEEIVREGEQELLKVEAKVERLEEEVGAKRAETTLLREEVMKEEIKIEASLDKLSILRMVNALLLFENLRDQDFIDDLARRILG